MINFLIKKIHHRIKSQTWVYWFFREWYVIVRIIIKQLFDKPKKGKTRILFYYVYGLAYGGTSSMMQILAKYLDKKKFEVFFMYSDKVDPIAGITISADSRLGFIQNTGVCLIPFNYEKIESYHPYFIRGMSPNVYDVIRDFNVDLMIVPGAGHAEFPFSTIKNIPIILLNIFGQPNIQENIKYHLCISEEVAQRLQPIVPKEKIKVIYVPTEGPMDKSAEGKTIRQSLGIPEKDIIFGRIGRNSDPLYDPVGIKAFKRVVKKFPNIHYLIVGAPQILLHQQQRENIPNIHFLPEIGTKEGLWAFYDAIDVLAHFRKDGESFGLNIVEAMYAQKPIISHKSIYWNAHLEYLEPSFAFVAEVDNIEQYAKAMEFFATDVSRVHIKAMGEKAKIRAEKFHIKNHIGAFESYIQEALK